MVEPEIEQGLDPDEIDGLEATYDIAQQETLEELGDFLEDEGYDPDEIEAYFDPASRRHRRHRRRTYDPAPRRRRKAASNAAPKRRKRRSKSYSQTTGKTGRKLKSVLGKLKNYAFPIAAGGSFLMQYAARADTLKASGFITTGGYGGILEAIKYDLTNFNASEAMTRVSSNASTIAAPLLGGYLIKNVGSGMVKSGMEKDLVSVVGDVLMGYGVATAAKKVLDPPIVQSRRVIQAQAHVITDSSAGAGGTGGWRV